MPHRRGAGSPCALTRPAPAPAPPQVGIIGPDKKFKVLTAAEVQDYLQEVE
jgi:hypothetical protein